MSAERKTEELVSYSKDGRFMHINTRVATESFLMHHLHSLQGVRRPFQIRYFIEGEVFEIASRELKTDDPESDRLFAEGKVEEIMTADYAEVELMLPVPQFGLPENEFIS